MEMEKNGNFIGRGVVHASLHLKMVKEVKNKD
jgi:hypothetical protein